jgi:outer membrane immunogenic protein
VQRQLLLHWEVWTSKANKGNHVVSATTIEGHAKMRLRLAILGASVAFAAGLSATAASADGYRPRAAYAVAPFTSWTGFYIGGHVGGAWSDVEWSNVTFSNVTFTGERFDNSASGFIGGGQIGYNQQIGNIVLGVEATISGADLSKDFHSILVPTVNFTADINTIATVTGRFGVAANQWLFYGKAGWAGAQVEASGRNTAPLDRFSFDDWRNGWTAGVGLEYKITRNVSFGVEYSFIELNNETDNGLSRLSLLPVTLRDRDLQIQSVTARLNFQFYRDEYRAPPLK